MQNRKNAEPRKHRLLALVLSLVMVLSLLPVTTSAAGTYTKDEIDSQYFYDQLNARAKAIYDRLLDEFTGNEKETYYDGTKAIDLIDLPYTEGGSRKTIDEAEAIAYCKGNKSLFNDFCAAKDALDLDHSELWWLDSGYLTFRVTHSSEEQELSEGYHILIGPGRGSTYLLGGLTPEKIAENKGVSIAEMDDAINNAIDDLVDDAVAALNASDPGTYSKADQAAALVTQIHDRITKGIHYRYEIECEYPEDAKFIRTIYGYLNHEGVCEAYARTLQVALRRAGVPCVLIHGVQTKGTPEDHMWNAVEIDGKWYVVDATWDDPLAADWYGRRDLTFNDGDDGKETNKYLLVGQSVVGEHWRPSGYVSTGNFEFTYPEIEQGGYAGAEVEGDFNGLKVNYSAGATQEDGTPAGVFTVTYNGMNAAEARKQGLYFMLKMYDYHADGTADVMDEWYYADATFILSENNPYFGDHENGLRLYTSTCEYVEIAVTTREPDGRETWSDDPYTSYLSLNPEAGYFHGDESEIIAQTGMLYNVNSSYEAPPYVKTQTPAPNGNATAGVNYHFKVTYDDDLYHILPSDTNALNELATADAYEDSYEQAKSQTVQVRYTTNQQDLHDGGKVIQHYVAGELNFDTDRDGVVDMEGTNFRWIYKYDDNPNLCKNRDRHIGGVCDVERGCPIVGVEFDFKASDQWIDDVTEYNFTIEGVVGSRSQKYPNNFSVIAVVPGLCPACYRSQGIDWNLWGQPTLLDAPENLDLYQMAQEGGTDKTTLEELQKQMNEDDLNGRLMLVVEDKSKGAGSREDYEKIDGELKENGQLPEGDIIASSVFEINFNRICPMVKLKPNQGQSLRVQVGYPAGVTYESLGEGKVELKAYHFTRCANNGEDLCDEYNAEYAAATTNAEKLAVQTSHKWGSHIIGVDEITIIPTPYGMVLMCEAFSPFEIVAIQTDDSAPVSASEHDVVIVSDGNGKVMVGREEAVGEDGNRKVADGEDLTFTVAPDNGYVVDTVSFGGEEVKPDAESDDTYTLTNVSKSDVLSVTFLPEEVKAEEEQQYGATVVVEVCPHTETEITVRAKEATCTEPGNTEEITCTACGTVVQKSTVIPATGHTRIETTIEAKEATCTEPGNTAAMQCQVCGQIVSAKSDIQALGHIFTNYVENGVVDEQGVQIEATCEREGCNETEIQYQKSEETEHKHAYRVISITDPTCTEDSVETEVCEICGETNTVTLSGTALGHDYVNGTCTRCGEINKDAETKPAAAIDYKNETLTGFGEGSYTVNDIDVTVTEGTVAIDETWFGETISIVKKGAEPAMDSPVQSLDIPARPKTPADLEGGYTSAPGLADGKVKGLTDAAYEYSTGSGDWKPIDADTGLAAGTYQVRLAATDSSFHSEAVTVSITDPGYAVTPAVAIDYANETLTGFETNASYTVNGEDIAVTEGTVAIKADWFGTTLTIVEKGDDSAVLDSKPQMLTVPARPAAPEGLSGTAPGSSEGKDGAITGLDSVKHYEYRASDGEEWVTVAAGSTSITGLAAGTYQVRTKAAADAFVSESAEVNVPAYVPDPDVPDPDKPDPDKPDPDKPDPDVPDPDKPDPDEPEPSKPEPSEPSASSNPSTSKTVTNPDGSITKTTTHSDGSKTTTTTNPDGVVGKTETDKNGRVTSAEVTVPAAAGSEEPVTAPVKMDAARDSKSAAEVEVKVEGDGSVKLEIPVTRFGPGTVAVAVHPDGTEEIVRDCTIGENGVVLNVEGDVTLKIVDNTKTFADVEGVNHWASDAVEFVAARELFNGTGENRFTPNGNMTRGMIVTVLYRLAYEPNAVAERFADVPSGQYYTDAVAWAQSTEVVTGYDGNIFAPDNNVKREQLVTILYRYARSQGYATETRGTLAGYADASSVSSWAADAMSWAIGLGLVTGVDATHLAPANNATRAEVATILMRFCEKVVK